MQHHNLPADERAVEDPRYSFRSLQAKLEQTAAHCAGVRHTKVRTVYLHAFGVSQKTRDESGGQLQNRSL